MYLTTLSLFPLSCLWSFCSLTPPIFTLPSPSLPSLAMSLYPFIIFLPHSFTIPLSLQSIRLHNHTLRCILTYLSPAQSHLLLSQEHEVLMHEPEIQSLSTAASSYNSRNIVALSFLRYSYVPAESFCPCLQYIKRGIGLLLLASSYSGRRNDIRNQPGERGLNRVMRCSS